jgi:pimeloyl-ACP methyl ester carboxylesterase
VARVAVTEDAGDELLPEARLVWLDEASHFALADATDRFVDAVLPFLAE